ncbi:MAG: peptidase domain-containing ABC transporter [Desulfobacterales bacterium]|nr:peptidase domain-containing ABC transporter [Desulfobacterales bacterium]
MNTIEIFKKISVFSELNSKELETIANLCTPISPNMGDLIHASGKEYSALFFIVSGKVKLVSDKIEGSLLTLDTLQEGSCFDENAFFSDLKSAYSVYCDSPSTILLKLTKTDLNHFLIHNKKIGTKIKDYEVFKTLKSFVSQTKRFSQLPSDYINDLIRYLIRVELCAGQYLIRKNDPADALYLVEKGLLKVIHEETSHQILRYIQPGDIVGEQESMTDTAYTTYVVTETDTVVYELSKTAFLKILKKEKSITKPLEIRSVLPYRGKTEVTEEKKILGMVEWDKVPQLLDKVKIPKTFKFRRFPEILQQSQMDCGAACLTMICRFYGKYVGINFMRDLVQVSRSGTSMQNLIQASNELGFEATPMKSNLDHLMQSHLPAIVNWLGAHWMVVYKITGHVIHLSDPAQGLIKMSVKEFSQGWNGYTLFLNPTEKFDTIQESKPALEPFKKYIQSYHRLIIEIFFGSLCLQCLNLSMPLFSKFIFDDIIIKQNHTWLKYALTAISIILLISIILNYFRQSMLSFVSMRVNLLMISDFYKKLLNLPLPFFENRKVGDITSRLQENQKMTRFFTEKGIQIVLELITCILYIGLMGYLSPSLTFVVCSFIVLHMGNVWVVTPYMKSSYRHVFQKNNESQSFLIESLTGVNTIKHLGVERLTRWTWEDFYIRFVNAYFKTALYGICSQMAGSFVNHLSQIAVLFTGTWLVLGHHITIGTLVAFMMMANQFSSVIIALVNEWEHFQEVLNSAERLNDILEAKPEVDEIASTEKIVVPKISGHVRLSHVSFNYTQDIKILKDISFETQAGQRIAIVGRSGSGKSTLIKLIAGFYASTSGKIYIDGFDVDTVYLPSLRKQIGMVPQHSYLFRGTIRENIAMGQPYVHYFEVMEAAKLVGAHEFITRFEKGYDTLLDANGGNLSGGQRQLIVLARAIIQSPGILILDEATSALDNESERYFYQNMNRIFPESTIFMIAHRLSTIHHADVILVMDQGTIVEKGSHDELMSLKGLYYYLYLQQLH